MEPNQRVHTDGQKKFKISRRFASRFSMMMMFSCVCGYTSGKRNVFRHKATCYKLRDAEIQKLQKESDAEIQKLQKENAMLRARLHEQQHGVKKKKRPGVSAQTKLRLVVRQKNRCNVCKAELMENHWDVDHILPWNISNDNSDQNLQIICMPCHRTKTTQEGKIAV
jgi:5-methylcytosine-specific restriction protein A